MASTQDSWFDLPRCCSSRRRGVRSGTKPQPAETLEYPGPHEQPVEHVPGEGSGRERAEQPRLDSTIENGDPAPRQNVQLLPVSVPAAGCASPPADSPLAEARNPEERPDCTANQMLPSTPSAGPGRIPIPSAQVSDEASGEASDGSGPAAAAPCRDSIGRSGQSLEALQSITTSPGKCTRGREAQGVQEEKRDATEEASKLASPAASVKSPDEVRSNDRIGSHCLESATQGVCMCDGKPALQGDLNTGRNVGGKVSLPRSPCGAGAAPGVLPGNPGEHGDGTGEVPGPPGPSELTAMARAGLGAQREACAMDPHKPVVMVNELSDTCAICLGKYQHGEDVHVLPCLHIFHTRVRTRDIYVAWDAYLIHQFFLIGEWLEDLEISVLFPLGYQNVLHHRSRASPGH